jgi:hypothetical protein
MNPAAFTMPVPATAQGNLDAMPSAASVPPVGYHPAPPVPLYRTGFAAIPRRFLQHPESPNFGSPINYLTSPQFGYATQMLNNYLGSGGQSGGLNPLYQIGGPRSIRLALKLQF